MSGFFTSKNQVRCSTPDQYPNTAVRLPVTHTATTKLYLRHFITNQSDRADNINISAPTLTALTLMRVGSINRKHYVWFYCYTRYF